MVHTMLNIPAYSRSRHKSIQKEGETLDIIAFIISMLELSVLVAFVTRTILEVYQTIQDIIDKNNK